MSPKQRECFDKNPGLPEDTEREKLLSGGSTSDLSNDDPLQPQLDQQIRNRYLTRTSADMTDDENA